jgi:hypothetical protein
VNQGGSETKSGRKGVNQGGSESKSGSEMKKTSEPLESEPTIADMVLSFVTMHLNNEDRFSPATKGLCENLLKAAPGALATSSCRRCYGHRADARVRLADDAVHAMDSRICSCASGCAHCCARCCASASN